LGGQALEGVLVKENEVHTKWSGIAGAGLGIVACLAQAPGVLRAIYPTKEDLEKVGGAYTSRVTLVTPKYEKIIVGIDDTDTKEKGATWAIALKIANELQEEGEIELLAHRIIQLNPEVKEKTTNCVSIALVFAAKTEKVEELISSFVKRLKELAVSEHAHIVIWRGVVIPQEIKEFGKKAKEEILNLDMAKKLVEEIDIEHYKITGERGLIGAIAAIAYADSGIEAAALAKDPALSIIS